MRAAIRALQRGYREAQIDPESAVAAMIAAEPRLDRAALAAQIDAVAPAWTAGAAGVRAAAPGVLRAGRPGTCEFGILERPLDVARAFDTTLVTRPAQTPDARCGPANDPSTGTYRAPSRTLERAGQPVGEPLHERGALARHARAGYDEVEARRLGARLTSWWTWE